MVTEEIKNLREEIASKDSEIAELKEWYTEEFEKSKMLNKQNEVNYSLYCQELKGHEILKLSLANVVKEVEERYKMIEESPEPFFNPKKIEGQLSELEAILTILRPLMVM